MPGPVSQSNPGPSGAYKPPDDHTIYCAFCGHAYPPGTPTSRSRVLANHIRKCPKHSIGKELRWLRKACKQLFAATTPFLYEAEGEADFRHPTWNPEAHTDLTVTIAECRALDEARKALDRIMRRR